MAQYTRRNKGARKNNRTQKSREQNRKVSAADDQKSFNSGMRGTKLRKLPARGSRAGESARAVRTRNNYRRNNVSWNMDDSNQVDWLWPTEPDPDTPECETHADCPGGYRCDGGQCKRGSVN